MKRELCQPGSKPRCAAILQIVRKPDVSTLFLAFVWNVRGVWSVTSWFPWPLMLMYLHICLVEVEGTGVGDVAQVQGSSLCIRDGLG